MLTQKFALALIIDRIFPQHNKGLSVSHSANFRESRSSGDIIAIEHKNLTQSQI